MPNTILGNSLTAFPDFSFEEAAFSKGYGLTAGVDEVGRGPLAGPVLVAAVILDPANIPEGLHDSKKLSKKKRDGLYEAILCSSHVAIASISAEVIDRINIRNATLQAMTQAVNGLPVPADFCLIDGNAIPKELSGRAEFVIKGDARCLSIAAASIVAKVTRDRMMEQAAIAYPGYGFEKHAGYGTPSHLEAIERQGPCAIHRMSFRPLKTETMAA